MFSTYRNLVKLWICRIRVLNTLFFDHIIFNRLSSLVRSIKLMFVEFLVFFMDTFSHQIDHETWARVYSLQNNGEYIKMPKQMYSLSTVTVDNKCATWKICVQNYTIATHATCTKASILKISIFFRFWNESN